MADEALNKVMERLEELSNQMNEIRNATEAGQNTQNLVKRQAPAEIVKGSDIPDSQEFIFKRPGNKEQYKFSRTILNLAKAGLEHFDEDGVLQDGEEGVFELLKAIADQTTKRIKHIKLADRSEAGWTMVQHYEADPIAYDSDDEKRINAAERKAVSSRKSSNNKIRRPGEFCCLCMKVESGHYLSLVYINTDQMN